MAIIDRETEVKAVPQKIWNDLIDDPNEWGKWLTPIRGYEQRVNGAVRPGLEMDVRLGKISGKIKVTEVTPDRAIKWKAGPAMMLAMGMGMRGTLELQPRAESTRVRLRMVTPMMMGPMMKMMAGLNPREEMDKTILRIKAVASA